MSRQLWPTAAILIAILALTAAFPTSARAEESVTGAPEAAPATTAPPPTPAPIGAPTSEGAAPAADFVSTKNIEDKLREAKAPRLARFNIGLRDAMNRIDDDFYRKTRIRFATVYTVLYQHAYGGHGPREAAGGDFDLIGTWDVLRRGGRTTGALEVALEGRHRIETEITPSALSTTIDSLWSTTSGFNVQNFAVIQAYWRQDLLNDRLHVRIGKLSAYSSFFGNRINSSSLFFSNFSFSDNPAVFMPGNGLGLHATWDFSSRWSLTGGIQNPNAIKTRFDPSTLRFGEFWSAMQVTYRTRIRGLGEGTYRVGAWYVTPREVEDTGAGSGGIVSIDQELGAKVIGFFRYEVQGESLISPENQLDVLTATRSTLRAGAAISGPIPRWTDDYLGAALAWGDPADALAKDSYVAEVFYRSQVTSTSQLTLSLQSIRSSTIFNEVLVLGLRLRIQL